VPGAHVLKQKGVRRMNSSHRVTLRSSKNLKTGRKWGGGRLKIPPPPSLQTLDRTLGFSSTLPMSRLLHCVDHWDGTI
jgi:hypothetical protein